MAGERREDKEKAKESKGDMTVSEAGHLGGEKTAETHGHEFYQEIGHKGGEIGGHKGGQRVKTLIEEGKEEERTHGDVGQSSQRYSR
jgi:uncharacterized protein